MQAGKREWNCELSTIDTAWLLAEIRFAIQYYDRALAPVLYFIEYGIGLKPDAPKNELTWKINSNKRSGCERFRFNGYIVDLIAEPTADIIKITVQSDDEFVLRVLRHGREKKFNIIKGKNDLLF